MSSNPPILPIVTEVPQTSTIEEQENLEIESSNNLEPLLTFNEIDFSNLDIYSFFE